MSPILSALLPSFFLLNIWLESISSIAVPSHINQHEVYCKTTHFPVLMYHHIREYSWLKDVAAKNLSVSPLEFKKQLDYLEQNWYKTITTADIKNDYVLCGSVMLTFDDGYDNVSSTALPLMQERWFRWIASIIIEKMDEEGYMSGVNIRTLQQHNWEIASHTWNHPILTGLPVNAIPFQIYDSKKSLENWFHTKINTFVYPGWYYWPETLSLTEQAWYKYAFTTRFGEADIWWKNLELRRIDITPGTTPEKLGELLRKAKETTIQ